MWLLYLYFIKAPLIDLYDLFGDLFEWAYAGAGRPSLPTISLFLDTMRDYGIVILANGAILIVWALYNQFRYRRRDIRRPSEPVSVADLAELYDLPADDITNWQQSRILAMQHDPSGTLVRVISKDRGQMLSTAPPQPTVTQAGGPQ
jgi:biofilm PGA synthesis protein PgaD